MKDGTKQCPTLKNLDRQSNNVWRTVSSMWEKECDPFQVFKVDHEACYHLEITVVKGEDITKGWGDYLDTPDPYVILRIPGSSNSSKRTSHIDNTATPLWETTFHFYLDPSKVKLASDDPDPDDPPGLVLNATLMDSNYTVDEDMGTDTLPLSALKESETINHIFNFPKGGKVYATILIERNKSPDLRFSLTLCEEEKAFLRRRRDNVMKSLIELLGEDGPKTKNEVPIMGIMGSGGGFRAMICLSGIMRALNKSGILNCATFVSGLSGSSWLISTLYAHDKFPNLSYDEVYEELKESVTNGWKWNLLHMPKYGGDMLRKYRLGQPVSFTDFFGHLLCDVLLKGKKHKKLSDQREIVSKGIVPFPLYTCLHAKASVSCKSFSEWVEFSPFEIGIAKYGTFMRTEDFGNKFIVGKITKSFPELPLHYLQGVWGSAFTILMKRFITGKSGGDMVQMMRDANYEERDINERLEEDGLRLEEESTDDTDDERDIDGDYDAEFLADSKSEDPKDSKTKKKNKKKNSSQEEPRERKRSGILSLFGGMFTHKSKTPPKKISNASDQDESFNISYKSDKKTVKKNLILKKSISVDDSQSAAAKLPLEQRRSKSFDLEDSEKDCPSYSPVDPTQAFKESERKISTMSDPGADEKRKSRMKRQGAVKSLSSEESPSERWARKAMQRQQQKEKETKNGIIRSLLENTNLMHSRAGRAGEILNPFRGLSLKQALPLSLSALNEAIDDEFDDMDRQHFSPECVTESLDNNAKKLFIVDSGLAFNSPYPLLLRPQRAVDIYLSFDFSQRPTDASMPFKELIIAENWARINRVPFPPIEKLAEEFSKDIEVKEVYVFEDENDPHCPVILHFPLVNNLFKWYSKPGVRRETEEEFNFADFPIFDDPDQSFSSTNFVYTELQYDRLVKLTEFNTLQCLETIKENLKKVIQKKRQYRKEYVKNITLKKIVKSITATRNFNSGKGIKLKVDETEAKKVFDSMARHRLLKKRSNDSGNSTGDEFEDALEDAIEESDEELMTPCAEIVDENTPRFFSTSPDHKKT